MYGSAGSCPGEVYNTSCFRVYSIGRLYHLNQEVKFLYKKKQISDELLYSAHLESVLQWQGMWLCEDTAINMKVYNIMTFYMIGGLKLDNLKI